MDVSDGVWQPVVLRCTAGRLMVGFDIRELN